MLIRPLHHLRRNLVAYLALFVALGGTSYAFLLPAGSVGGRQIRNHVIDPVKFNPRYISGSVRAWAEVTADGRVIAGRGRPTVTVRRGSDSTGTYLVHWRTASILHCLPIAGVDGSSSQLGWAQAQTLRGATAFVAVFDGRTERSALPFYVAVMC